MSKVSAGNTGGDGTTGDGETIPFAPRPTSAAGAGGRPSAGAASAASSLSVLDLVRFDRFELDSIMRVYGRMVASGDWRDYALDMGVEAAIFAVFRRSSEVPLYTIVKEPALARKQGAYRIVAASGFVVKRGPDLPRVLAVFDKPRLVTV